MSGGIRIVNLTKRYGGVRAVNALNLDIRPGRFATLLGPSGCGKTTTLRCVAGLETPDSGDIFLGTRQIDGAGIHVPVHQRNVGMVFQSFAVWPHMTVFDNVAYPLRIRKTSRAQTMERSMAALASVGLAGLDKRYPAQLSGGQQQRVALARAIVAEPDYILYDEPLSSLDARLREQMRFELRALHDRLGITALYVTHDQQEAMVLSDEIHVLQKGEIVQSGAPMDIYNRPGNLFVSEFVGSANTFPVESLSPNGHGLLSVQCTDGLRFVAAGPAETRDGARSMVVRPHRIGIVPNTHPAPPDPHGNRLVGRIVEAAFLGDRIRYAVEVAPDRKIIVEAVAGPSVLALGSDVTLTIGATDCIVL